jgi:hypothetical protein
MSNPRPTPEDQQARIAAIQKAIRALDCGALHCRYCPAGSRNGWQHEAHCAYVESVKAVETAEQALDALASAQAACVWTEDSDGQWNSGCGRTWEFIDDGPAENRMDFCHGCGHPVRAVAYIDTIVDEDEPEVPHV